MPPQVGPIIPANVQPQSLGTPVPQGNQDAADLSSLFGAQPPMAKQDAAPAPSEPPQAPSQDMSSLFSSQPSPQATAALDDDDSNAVREIQGQMLKQSGNHAFSADEEAELKAVRESLDSLENKGSSLWDPDKSINENVTGLLDRGQAGLGRSDMEKLAPYIQHYGENNVKLENGVISVRNTDGKFSPVAGDSKVNFLTGEGSSSDLIKFLVDHSGDALAIGGNVAAAMGASSIAASVAPKVFAPSALAAAGTAAEGGVATSMPIAGASILRVLEGGAGSAVRSMAMHAMDFLRGTHQDLGIENDVKDAVGQGLGNLFISHGYAGLGKTFGLASTVFKASSQMPIIKALGAIKNRVSDYLGEMGWENLGLEKTGGMVKTAIDDTHAKLNAGIAAVDGEAKRLIGDNPIQMPTVQAHLAKTIQNEGGEIDSVSGRAILPGQAPAPAKGIPLSTEMSDAQMANAEVSPNAVSENARRASIEAANFKADSAFGDVNGRSRLQRLVDLHNGIVSSNAVKGGIDYKTMNNLLDEFTNMGTFTKDNPKPQTFTSLANSLRHSAAEDRNNLYDSIFSQQNSEYANVWKQSYKNYTDNIGAVKALNSIFQDSKSASLAAQALIEPNNPNSVRQLKAIAPDAFPALRAEWINGLFEQSTAPTGVVRGDVVKNTLKGFGDETLTEMFKDMPDMKGKLYGLAEDAMKIRANKVFSPDELSVNPGDLVRLGMGAAGHPWMAMGAVGRMAGQVFQNKNAMDYLLNEGWLNTLRNTVTEQQKATTSKLILNLQKAVAASRVVKVGDVPMYVPSFSRAAISSIGATKINPAQLLQENSQ